MNPLTNVLSGKYRRAVYLLWSLAVLVTGCLSIADIDTGPAIEIIAYLGGALGLTAASNVDTTTPDPHAHGDFDDYGEHSGGL